MLEKKWKENQDSSTLTLPWVWGLEFSWAGKGLKLRVIWKEAQLQGSKGPLKELRMEGEKGVKVKRQDPVMPGWRENLPWDCSWALESAGLGQECRSWVELGLGSPGSTGKVEPWAETEPSRIK